MVENQQPLGIVDPISRAVWNIFYGQGGVASKLNEEIGKIRQETKSVSAMNETIAELNETLKNTNNILREVLDAIK